MIDKRVLLVVRTKLGKIERICEDKHEAILRHNELIDGGIEIVRADTYPMAEAQKYIPFLAPADNSAVH